MDEGRSARGIDQKREASVISVDNERLKDAVAHDLRRYGLVIGIVETPSGQAVRSAAYSKNPPFVMIGAARCSGLSENPKSFSVSRA